jgi:pyruvate-ferredoxin/flavodoxin oxidoreductase
MRSALIDNDWVRAHRARALNPDHPVMRGTAQNPDTYFQSRESVNPFYEAVPARVQQCMESLGELTGRHYRLVEYHGATDATDVIVLMGSGAATARTTVDWLNRQDRKTGVLVVRLYRPSRCRRCSMPCPRAFAAWRCWIAPGAGGRWRAAAAGCAERADRRLAARPYQAAALAERSLRPLFQGVHPAMCAAVFEELASDAPRRALPWIVDDVSGLSLAWHPIGDLEPASGCGRSSSAWCRRHSGRQQEQHQDHRRAGGLPRPGLLRLRLQEGLAHRLHLRFGPEPIDAPWLIEQASFIGCHQWGFC